ncbi:MAG: universal stress protein [Planctomycetota bacterium]|nr:universal stress protein [Planctomycetota bacterium]MDE1888984.1 universal stress protein [Planctomycetota bacterium]MDE2215912.1 universal stress protein [Planctomycetota bacterium]
MIKLKKILCPIDFSACSKHALSYAIDLSAKESASLYLIHVIEAHLSGIGDILKQLDLLLDDKQIEDNLKMRLISLLPDDVRKSTFVEPIIAKGIPFVEIVNTAKDKRTDLIVMGTHGKTGLEHILIGSVAERVIQRAPCPVLSIRLPK